MSSRVKILVVEDDRAIREGVAIALEDEGYIVTAVEDAVQAMDCVREESPDLGIIDIGLPGVIDGLQLGRRLRTEWAIPLVFVTARGAMEDRLAGFEVGADDYVVKPFEVPELLARIRVILRRSGHLQETIWQLGPIRIDEAAHTTHVDGDSVTLTATEFEMLLHLIRHRAQVQSKSQLMAQVQGNSYGSQVVESHISSLRRKLGEAGSLIRTVRGYGYVIG